MNKNNLFLKFDEFINEAVIADPYALYEIIKKAKFKNWYLNIFLEFIEKNKGSEKIILNDIKKFFGKIAPVNNLYNVLKSEDFNTWYINYLKGNTQNFDDIYFDIETIFTSN